MAQALPFSMKILSEIVKIFDLVGATPTKAAELPPHGCNEVLSLGSKAKTIQFKPNSLSVTQKPGLYPPEITRDNSRYNSRAF